MYLVFHLFNCCFFVLRPLFVWLDFFFPSIVQPTRFSMCSHSYSSYISIFLKVLMTALSPYSGLSWVVCPHVDTSTILCYILVFTIAIVHVYEGSVLVNYQGRANGLYRKRIVLMISLTCCLSCILIISRFICHCLTGYVSPIL